MMRINVKEARKELSTLLDKVEAGEEVVITRHGKAIAKLSRLREGEVTVPDLRAFRASLVAKVQGKPTLVDVLLHERDEAPY